MKSQTKLIGEFENGAQRGAASNMFIEGDTLYSYGHHFPLVIRYDMTNGYQFVVNGDRYSVSTSAHQNQCFGLGPQIPFSALHAARIQPSEMDIQNARADRYIQVPDPQPDDPEHERTEHILGAVLLTFRGRYYLSSVDENEPWQARSYFLSQLPIRVRSVDEAFDSLVPDEVKRWRAEGRPPDRRQGEWFFLPSDYRTRQLPRPSLKHAQLLDTNHFATEMRLNGNLFCRRVIRHRPEGRTPQHRNLKLGKIWHIAVKNLAVASWNAIGQVD